MLKFLQRVGEFSKYLNIPLGKYAGIPVHLHWTWVLFAIALAIIFGSVIVPFVLLLFFLFIILHEFGHAITAQRFGIPCHGITMYPIGGVASIHVPDNRPKEEFWITIMGPAVNLVFAALFGIVYLCTQIEVLLYFFKFNLFMALFNMIPAWPMDGGRILRAVLSWRFGHYTATKFSVYTSYACCLGLIIIAVVTFHPMLVVIAPMVALFATSEWERVKFQREAARHEKAIHDLLSGDMEGAEATAALVENERLRKNLSKYLHCVAALLMKPAKKDNCLVMVDELLGMFKKQSGFHEVSEKMMELEIAAIAAENEVMVNFVNAIDRKRPEQELRSIVEELADKGYRDHCLAIIANRGGVDASPDVTKS